MADLVVDTAALEAAATELGLLVHEFDRAEDIASDAREVLGSPRVADAVHEFSANWEVHRGDLLESMQAVRKMVTSSHDTFVKADTDLAEQIRAACQTQDVSVPGGPR